MTTKTKTNRIARCHNPDHVQVTGTDLVFILSSGRGRPRKYCSTECSRYVMDHFWSAGDGTYTRKVRTWVVPASATKTRVTRSYADARQAVSVAMGDGYLDPPLDGGMKVVNGRRQFYPSHDGGVAAAIGALMLTPDVTAEHEPFAYDPYDPAATEDEETVGITDRIKALLPVALVRYLGSRNPLPRKAVGMVRLLAEHDAGVQALYLDIISHLPDYADARAMEADLDDLIHDFPRL